MFLALTKSLLIGCQLLCSTFSLNSYFWQVFFGGNQWVPSNIWRCLPPEDFVLTSCTSPSLNSGLGLWLSCIAVTMEWLNETLVREFVFLGLLISGWTAAAALCYLPAGLPLHPGHQCRHHLHHCAGQSPHTPMYFFLCCTLLFWDCYTFIIVPKMLVDLLVQKKTISFLRSIQMFSFLF